MLQGFYSFSPLFDDFTNWNMPKALMHGGKFGNHHQKWQKNESNPLVQLQFVFKSISQVGFQLTVTQQQARKVQAKKLVKSNKSFFS